MPQQDWPGVEHGAVHQVLDGVREIRVGAHVGGVLAAQLQPGADEAIGGRLLHRVAAGDRAGERDEVDQRRGDHSRRLVMGAVHELEHALRQSGVLERLGEALRAQRRLIRVLQHHGVAGHERGHHRVHRGEIGVVPRRQHQHHAERLAADEAAEAVLRPGIEVRQCLRCDRHHVARTLLEAAHLAGRLADRPAHLPGDLLGDLLLACDECVDEARHDRGALGERHLLPLCLRRPRALQHAPDLASVASGRST